LYENRNLLGSAQQPNAERIIELDAYSQAAPICASHNTQRTQSPEGNVNHPNHAVAPDLSARGCVPGLRKSRYADVLARLRLTPIGHDRLPPSATQKFNPQATLVQGRYFETTVGDKRSGFGHLCKLFDDRLEGHLQGETFSRREIGGFDDVLDSSSDRRSMSM
jgi:hypothetical protein